MELIIGIIGIGCGLFFLYVNIVSRLNYDVFIDNDDESYEGELLQFYYYPSYKEL